MNTKLPDFTNVKILVVGDVMLDRYWHGDTRRISPEAPVPVVHIKDLHDQPGGAANVALNIGALGANVTLLGITGNDANAKTLYKLLDDKRVTCHFQKSDVPTTSKLRIISHNQQLIRLDFEELYHHINYDALLKTYKKQLAHTDLVIISDYGKGIAACTRELINIAKENHIPIIIDPKGKDFSIYKHATAITPNFHEFEAIVGPCANEKEIAEKGTTLLQQLHLGALLITRGANGMSLIQANQPVLHIPTKSQEVYDVTGAGDTVIATLGSALAAQVDMGDAVELANSTAGIAVRKFGSATVSVQELRRALRKHNESFLGIIDEERLLQEVEDAKEHGETIVMTNGCFDIIHAGHIAYLEQAKELGTRLIVAVNEDESVRQLKGDTRPINPLQSRMEVLAGLRPVDWVIPFKEDTPAKLIKKITPNILVKGGDYKPEEIAGADHVIAKGGTVKILTFVANHSSSEIIKKIQGE
ncbi:MAG: bifunctional D-glycero-beta-D-manno-heptose-7-phosphate kinase/D-glycero-beta-D-manno-heptose 1-phosphate adenylyltransferase HldE [Gammaproteobacteria bacterium]|nr:bifunctional D-glycero-beta-D-manno-heptose-7-phosphate kinase/D-glycero-beta-D-manno-heptose 1-phosphate adenylyltransferase HldE [Gammaproteobacteria bacterium]